MNNQVINRDCITAAHETHSQAEPFNRKGSQVRQGLGESCHQKALTVNEQNPFQVLEFALFPSPVNKSN